MITFLKGLLVEKQPTRVVVETGGIGYEIFIPLGSFERLPAVDRPCMLLIHDHVREDQHTLYGFSTEAERRMFIMLMGVSGIGPRLALSSLSGLSLREMRRAVVEGDAKRLSMIPGIGKKMAERIVLELRDRIGAADALESSSMSGGEGADTEVFRDAVRALISLGYKQAEARAIVQKTIEAHPEIETVEDLIRRSLAR
ncbi:MAG: Holliday junction branch migration protein RuvA [Lentisphaerales bacterium]|jgi:Holliday junction DNA helicase RuvA|nr:MAG: Holliday junction branch migration protein RuvA [Lentisphaerales bacterium]